MNRIPALCRMMAASAFLSSFLPGCETNEPKAQAPMPPVIMEGKADATFCIVPRRKPRGAENTNKAPGQEKPRYILEFMGDTDIPTKESLARVQSISEALKARPGGAVTIIGHVRGIGNAEEDIILARARAMKAAKILAGEGVDLTRASVITCGPEGADRPVPPGTPLSSRGAVEILPR